ncbi:hypothetical protein O983_27300 [Mycobacterium avium 09-5983]|nr:hypothetical protein O983_27300 [Mycobacterium avium 09-5983]
MQGALNAVGPAPHVDTLTLRDRRARKTHAKAAHPVLLFSIQVCAVAKLQRNLQGTSVHTAAIVKHSDLMQPLPGALLNLRFTVGA